MIWLPNGYKELEGGCIVALNFRGEPYHEPQPRIVYKGKKWITARLSYCLNVEEIPRTPVVYGEGLVLHTCDNKWCINYNHLYLGTSANNVQDMWDRLPGFREKVSEGLRSAQDERNRLAMSKEGLN